MNELINYLTLFKVKLKTPGKEIILRERGELYNYSKNHDRSKLNVTFDMLCARLGLFLDPCIPCLEEMDG